MYARELATNLRWAFRLDEPSSDTDRRLESLRGYGQLPRGRANASVRLSDQQIANVIMGFVPKPGWAGHVALVMGDLRPVGGIQNSFHQAPTLRDCIAAIIGSDAACTSILSVAFVIEHEDKGDEYRAQITIVTQDVRRRINFVSHLAASLLQPGAEERYDPERHVGVETRLVLGAQFFSRLRRDVEISRHLDIPLKTDWREYKSEEERDAFHARLGARSSSNFLHLSAEGTVTWPAEPTRVRFGGHHFVLFPKTRENQRSISLDLANEKLTSDEARTFLNRFLSLLSWCDDGAAVLGDGWSGNPVPVPVRRGEVGGSITHDWHFERVIPSDEDLLQRLAYYREGHNARFAGLVTFEVLSFFKVFESRSPSQRGQVNPTKAWIKSVFEVARSTIDEAALKRFEDDLGGRSVDAYVYDNCRVATAHASAAFPSDADSSFEVRRLYGAADVVRALARHYIKTMFDFSQSRFKES